MRTLNMLLVCEINSTSEMTYIVSSGVLNSTHSLMWNKCGSGAEWLEHRTCDWRWSVQSSHCTAEFDHGQVIHTQCLRHQAV